MLAFFYPIDPLYLILAIPGVLLALWAQLRVKSAVAHWSQVPARRGMTGSQAAAAVLAGAGIDDVKIEQVDGFLSDHYDPRSKTLRLSEANYSGRSVAAFGIAAHEAGHAIQHATGYAPLTIRSVSVPAASIGSWLSWPIIVVGAALAYGAQAPGGIGGLLVLVGIALFSLTVFFQLVTVPVEIDASRRAKISLESEGLLTGEEGVGARQVLNAAAWTYVAAAAASILQLLYFIIRYGSLIGGGSRDDRS
jgi:Zn-dependent membrane protease YugP